jgi:hypothetical protein
MAVVFCWVLPTLLRRYALGDFSSTPTAAQAPYQPTVPASPSVRTRVPEAVMIDLGQPICVVERLTAGARHHRRDERQ